MVGLLISWVKLFAPGTPLSIQGFLGGVGVSLGVGKERRREEGSVYRSTSIHIYIYIYLLDHE